MSETIEFTRGELVYEDLKKRIISLKIEPGTPLQEAEITKAYDASRTPVREALARLSHEGFLVRWGRGYRIRSFSPLEVKELYEVREALEKMAVRLTIETSSPEKIKTIETQLEHYQSFIESNDINAFNLHANSFHMTIAQLSGNQNLLEQLTTIHEKVRLISARYLLRSESIQNAFLEHSRIYNAILRGDVVVAEAAMREHIQEVIEFFRAQA
ncbi:GntR family transcriptional regulator [Agaricicola taiwanensis]|uniref:GntR family transcriptional regulator n=1 Tax=Agaricicola taiwanensis TaxID=591372 RepID=A0A8J2VJW2_9RHOB|nr:GntR family transcriptional regulator [Agaricicola taiwanensis]GGE28076.1 GntR family transcriptional regulator [Agaricicola taiwanensis]